MLTAVILAQEGDEERLARTLASLLAGVLEGLVRDAVVVDPGTSPGLAMVADHAGCAVAASLNGAMQGARGDWLLVLEAGARPGEGWGEAARNHTAASRRPTRFRARGGVLSLFAGRGRPFRRGLLVRREEALAKGEAGLARLATARLRAGLEPRR